MRKQNPLKRVIHQTNLNMVTQFCYMFDAIFPTLKAPNVTVAGGVTATTKTTPPTPASISITRATSTSIDDDAIIECGFIDVKIHNDFVGFFYVLSVCLSRHYYYRYFQLFN